MKSAPESGARSAKSGRFTVEKILDPIGKPSVTRGELRSAVQEVTSRK